MCAFWYERGGGLAGILNPIIGYEAAAKVAKEAVKTGKSLREIIIGKGMLSTKKVDEILDPIKMTSPNV